MVLRWGLALALLAPVVRTVVLLHGGTPGMNYVWSPCRMDALALGGSAAAALRVPGLASTLLEHRARLLAGAAAAFVACVVACHGLPRTTFVMQTLGYTLLAVSFALLVLALACVDLAGDAHIGARLWRVAPLRMLARYSYGIYILHKLLQHGIGTPLMQSLGEPALHSTTLNVALFFVGRAAFTALAALSYHLFGQRFLALKARVR